VGNDRRDKRGSTGRDLQLYAADRSPGVSSTGVALHGGPKIRDDDGGRAGATTIALVGAGLPWRTAKAVSRRGQSDERQILQQSSGHDTACAERKSNVSVNDATAHRVPGPGINSLSDGARLWS
jgi:hypothetical protein